MNISSSGTMGISPALLQAISQTLSNAGVSVPSNNVSIAPKPDTNGDNSQEGAVKTETLDRVSRIDM